MKAIAALLLLTTSLAYADDDDGFDTKKALVGKAWVTKFLDAKATVDAPTKDKPLDYILDVPTKECKALKPGTAKDDKAFAKVRTCVVATAKANGATEGQWIEIKPARVADVISEFPAKYAKALKAQAKGSTIVEGHFSGDGINTDIYLALDADDHPHALWVTQSEFE